MNLNCNKILKKIMANTVFVTVYLLALNLFSQETIPIDQDYLSDNIFLIHPSAAGIGETGKVRVAVRMQALGVANSPQVQTASIHGTVGPTSKAAFGLLLVNNQNSISFTNQAIQGTYAYHLPIDKSNRFEQLSLGVAVSAIQSEIGGANVFSGSGFTQSTQVLFYLNADISAAYHLKGLSTYVTVKNAYISSRNEIFSSSNEINVRNYVFGASYFFGDVEAAQYEPSIMVQHKDGTGEKIIDVNFKAYKNFDNGQIWGALSFRKSFGSIYSNNTQYFSPIVGINSGNMMFAYTYSKQIGDIILSNGEFHQISIGMNVLFRELKLDANPNINSTLF